MNNDKNKLLPKFVTTKIPEDNLEDVISCLKSKLYKSGSRLTISSIQIALNIGFNRAKRIYIRLKKEGYLNDSDCLV